ncbi:acetamidase/formamidase family protein [Halomicroarcula sp. GCM10025324]|uniref:acetamidase/formamidase family protein n=1 Tax=Haloarcula TaxID=2237 RepID=UPI0023E80B93|nr:acetamidase/formamidase family protein [Halomicroarcula sp. ZS-22-S1]
MNVDRTLSHESALHTSWNNDIPPALEVESGAVVQFDCLNDSGPNITPETDSADLPDIEFVGHHLTGPVAVEGAEPGDVLQVEILDVDHADWGYTLIRSGDRNVGLLPEMFSDPYLYHWDLDEDVAHFEQGIEVPTAPFPGVVGVAPAEAGTHETGPPRAVGGNMDIKHLSAGSVVYLPVAVTDALFSIGDGHAAQGDGEVCISAIETPTTVTTRLTLRKDLDIDTPQFETNGPFTPSGHDEKMYATTGIRDDLMAASKDAVRQLIEHLHDRRGLTKQEAYVLCSVAADLKINEVVDEPNWVVSAYIAQSLFPDDPAGGV